MQFLQEITHRLLWSYQAYSMPAGAAYIFAPNLVPAYSAQSRQILFEHRVIEITAYIENLFNRIKEYTILIYVYLGLESIF